MGESKLRFYSLAIAVKDKEVGSDELYVTPIEAINLQNNGDLTNQTATMKGDLSDPITGETFQTEHTVVNQFVAKWIQFGGSNRMSAPDIYKGETVLIFKYDTVDEYFWTTLFREPNLRKLETVAYAFSNVKEPLKAFDTKTSYWVKVDTRSKVVSYSTPDNDGELTTYVGSIDAVPGILTLYQDGHGNFYRLDSKNDVLTIYTLKKIEVKDQNGNSVVIDANSNTVTINAKSSVTINTPNTYIKGHLHVSNTITAGSTISTPARVNASNVG